MVHLCLLGSTIVRSQRNNLPRTFCRHKSLTAAIERGRQSYEAPGQKNYKVENSDKDYRSRPLIKTYRAQQYSGSFGERSLYRSISERGDEGKSFRDGNHEREPRDRSDARRPFHLERDEGRHQHWTDQGRPNLGRESREQSDGRSFYLERGEERPQQRTDQGRPSHEKESRERSDDRKSFHLERGDGRPQQRTEHGRPFRQEQWGAQERAPREEASYVSPESLPYTTAASEFLYGYSSVLAAIKANRRKLYKLYMHTRGQKNVGSEALVARARAARLNIQEVGDEYLRVLDKTSSGRPHNGFILEASPLPVPPITELRSSSVSGASFQLTLDKQSKEDAAINGNRQDYPYKSAGWRHPFVLYVDGVLDEGNLGAIARSAYFLGVDAIATPSRQSAPWSHVALKASAGAAEAIPIFSVNQPAEFLGRSAREGWRIYASDAVPPAEQRPHFGSSSGEAVPDNFASNVIYTYTRSTRRLPADHCPVENHPTILMMGAEGSGLRASLLNAAHYKVGIRHGREVDEVGVDSLNVSVAASLLCYEVLRKPKKGRVSGDLLF